MAPCALACNHRVLQRAVHEGPLALHDLHGCVCVCVPVHTVCGGSYALSPSGLAVIVIGPCRGCPVTGPCGWCLPTSVLNEGSSGRGMNAVLLGASLVYKLQVKLLVNPAVGCD